jgi:hypothetical protein
MKTSTLLLVGFVGFVGLVIGFAMGRGQSASIVCSSALGGLRQFASPLARRLTLSMSRTCTESTAHHQSDPSAGSGPASREEILGFELYFCIASGGMSGERRIADVGVVRTAGPLSLHRCLSELTIEGQQETGCGRSTPAA